MGWSLDGYKFPVAPSDYRTPSVKSRPEYVRSSRGASIRDRRADEAVTVQAYILQWEAMPASMYNRLLGMYEVGGQYVLNDDCGNTILVYFKHDGWQLEQQLAIGTDGEVADVWYEGLVTFEKV